MAPLLPRYMPSTLQNLLLLPHELFSTLEQPTSSTLDAVSHEAVHLASRLIPSRTIPNVAKRQYSTLAIPATYDGIRPGQHTPPPGEVVGIVLGAVAGFILIVWLLWTLANYSGSSAITAESVEIVRRDRSPGHAHSHSRRSRRSRRTSERIEVRERSPARREETIIIEDRRAPPTPVIQRETIIVDERREPRVAGDDIVEVLESESGSDVRSPRRTEIRRETSRRTSRRVSGGYRSVDPNSFGGGEYPRHKVRRDRSYSGSSRS